MAVSCTHQAERALCVAGCRRALALVESVLSLLIVGMMLVAALNMVGAAARTRSVNKDQECGLALAEHLMTEILPMAYKETMSTPVWGAESGEQCGTRVLFDDVDDYDGWSESPPQLKNGSVLTDYEGWKRTVSVKYASSSNLNTDISSDGGLKRIRVTVTNGRGKTTTLVALRAQDGAYLQIPENGTFTFGSVGLNLQIGNTPSSLITSGIHLLNEPIANDSVAQGGEESGGQGGGTDNRPPVAVAKATPMSGNKGLSVSFWGDDSTDADSYDTLTYSWDFGDGTSANNAVIQHVYPNAGTYGVTLVVSDNHGATSTAPLNITVYP